MREPEFEPIVTLNDNELKTIEGGTEPPVYIKKSPTIDAWGEP